MVESRVVDPRFRDRTADDDDQMLFYLQAEFMLDPARLRVIRDQVRRGLYSDYSPWPSSRVAPSRLLWIRVGATEVKA